MGVDVRNMVGRWVIAVTSCSRSCIIFPRIL